MSEYKVGQRVRIEWPDGSAVEGVVQVQRTGPAISVGAAQFPTWYDLEWVGGDGRTVTILSEPRPDEPTGLGAVVRATVNGHRIVCNRDHNGVWWPHRDMGLGEWRTPPWSAMGDPEILFEGVSE